MASFQSPMSLSHRLAFHSIVVTACCRGGEIFNRTQTRRDVNDAIIDAFIDAIEERNPQDSEWKDHIISESGSAVAKKDLANRLRQTQRLSWKSINILCQELGVTLVLLLDEVHELISDISRETNISENDTINNLWDALSPATICSHLIVVPVCPSFLLYRLCNTVRSMKYRCSTVVIPLMLPPLEEDHIAECLDRTSSPISPDRTLSDQFGLNQEGTLMLARALYRHTLGLPRMVHYAIEYLLRGNLLQGAIQTNGSLTVQMIDALVSGSHVMQRKTDLFPFKRHPTEQDMDDFLHIALLSSAGVPVILNELFYFSEAASNSGYHNIAEFSNRFHLWYAPKEREPYSYRDYTARIVIPTMSLNALSRHVRYNSRFLHDMRIMAALLMPDWQDEEKTEVGGPINRNNILDELTTRFLTYHKLLQPMAQTIASSSGTAGTWGDLCSMNLFRNSEFLYDKPIPSVYKSGCPFPCFGFKDNIGQTWGQCITTCLEPRQFWDRFVEADQTTADTMYEFVLSKLDRADTGQWVMLHPRPLSAGPNAIMLDRSLGDDGMRQSIQIHIILTQNCMTCECLQDDVSKILKVTPNNWRTTLLFFRTSVSSELRDKFNSDGVLYLKGIDVPGIADSVMKDRVELIVVSLEDSKDKVTKGLKKLISTDSGKLVYNFYAEERVIEWTLRELFTQDFNYKY